MTDSFDLDGQAEYREAAATKALAATPSVQSAAAGIANGLVADLRKGREAAEAYEALTERITALADELHRCGNEYWEGRVRALLEDPKEKS